MPAYRYLRGYTLDPGFSNRLDTMQINESTYRIDWELLDRGPQGEYIDVIDHDPASDCFYEAVDLNDVEVLSQNGLSPSEGNPQFHQQLVYAVAMKTIGHFERALGRKIIWRYKNNPARKDNSDESYLKEYVQQLRIYPHALREPNAYYDQEKICLAFGYFHAAQRLQGSNFPGGVVFTCLSPDIVAHETTHAILDSIHERFTENTNVDVPAFHEAFADIVALLQRFTFKELVQHQLQNARGRLDGFSILGDLATQFGEAQRTSRGALRSAIGRVNPATGLWEKLTPDPKDYQQIEEPHHRGAILVATIFDAFLRLYHFRTEDLLRIATNGTGKLPEGSVNIDLIKRLAKEASEIAEHLLLICIRALDYCPPTDITFGNYLRALITADIDSAPEDNAGYRVALIEAFRARGIFPDRVNTFSVESLQWNRTEFTPKEKNAIKHMATWLQPRIRELVDDSSRQSIYLKTRRLQADFHRYLHDTKKPNFEPEHWEKFLNKLGLCSTLIKIEHKGKQLKFNPPPIEVHKIRPAFRIGREGKMVDQVVISLSQTVHATIDGEKVKFRGGSTIILSLSNLKDIEYIISKNVYSSRRFSKQMEYQLDEVGNPFALHCSTYQGMTAPDINFKELHFSGDH